jgi:excisionase family DNA binding protein
MYWAWIPGAFFFKIKMSVALKEKKLMVPYSLPDDKLSPMLTVNEVARLLSIHPGTVRRWEKGGHLKACRLGPGGCIRFRRDDVLRLLSTNSRSDHFDNGKSPGE